MRTRIRRSAAIALPLLGATVTALALLAGPRPTAGKTAKSLATELARLRAEVETLSGKVEAEKADLKARLHSLSRQKAELDAQVRREAVRLAQLQRRIQKWKDKIAARAKAQQKLVPVVDAGAKVLEQAIGRSMPFKREARKKEIQKLRDRMHKELATPSDSVARLWDRVEDELRLSRESGLYRQVVQLDGKEQLVEVARVGMVLMYFRSKDGRYGMARRTARGWGWTRVTAEAQTQRIERLFDAFKKQIRTGFFELPGGLPAPQGKAGDQ
jgi:outer membrane murein-binding lipoprotein Lpp